MPEPEVSSNGKNTLLSRITGPVKKLPASLRRILIDLYNGEITYSSITNKIANFFKVFIVSTRKFLDDDCLTKASSIAYTTIVSLIPTLAVVLTFYSIFAGASDSRDILFRKLTILLMDHNIKLNLDPVFEVLSGLIDNAAKIGGIGAVVMVFSATAVLRTIEQSLNDIWEVKRGRSMLQRLIYYWTALTMGPLLIIVGTTVAGQLSSSLLAPDYISVTQSGPDLWTVGSKAFIRHNGPGGAAKTLTRKNIEFDNQVVRLHDNQKNEFIEHDFKIHPSEFSSSQFNDIQFVGKKGWIVGDRGIILHSEDGGITWIISKWGSFNLKNICMLNEKRGFIAADMGTLLSTTDGGKTWQAQKWPDFMGGFNGMDFLDNQGIVVGDNGTVLVTTDGGLNWNRKVIENAKKDKRFLDLNAVQIVSPGNIWIAGKEGKILHTTNGGRTWKSHKFHNVDYHSILFMNDRVGYIGGEKGYLFYTDNAGKKWQYRSVPTPRRINRLYMRNEVLTAIGANGMMLQSKDRGVNWSGVSGRNTLVYILTFVAPFMLIWLFFLLTYILFPNVHVSFKPAALGAAFTGTVWVVFIMLFKVYINYFAKGQIAIYGALASIPIFLLMIYSSAVIILYGGEVSYTLMHPHTYKNLKRALSGKREIQVYYGLAILHYIYKKFEDGRGATEYRELMELTMNKSEDIDLFLSLFRERDLVLDEEDDRFMPGNSSRNVSISRVMDFIMEIGLSVPKSAKAQPALRKYLAELFGRMQKARAEIIGDVMLSSIIYDDVPPADTPGEEGKNTRTARKAGRRNS